MPACLNSEGDVLPMLIMEVDEVRPSQSGMAGSWPQLAAAPAAVSQRRACRAFHPLGVFDAPSGCQETMRSSQRSIKTGRDSRDVCEGLGCRNWARGACAFEPGPLSSLSTHTLASYDSAGSRRPPQVRRRAASCRRRWSSATRFHQSSITVVLIAGLTLHL